MCLMWKPLCNHIRARVTLATNSACTLPIILWSLKIVLKDPTCAHCSRWGTAKKVNLCMLQSHYTTFCDQFIYNAHDFYYPY